MQQFKTMHKLTFFILLIVFSAVTICWADQVQEKSCRINQDECCWQEDLSDTGLISRPEVHEGQLFRAAVLEHRIVQDSSLAKSLDANLAIYRKVAQKASENGVNVLVFPEDGLYLPRGDIEPLLVTLPDPHQLLSDERNPCQASKLYESNYILRNLSCIAKENNLYVIANFGTKQNCEPDSEVGNRPPKCPKKGYLALNTDVVIDPKGNFVERYRKFNMFLELFDKAASLETVYFDSPYGRFGIFTCFDMLFLQPAIDLVEKHHINTAIFPTLWYDELPILSALQFQDGWSWTNRVNLLASNIHITERGTTGSGIYSGYNSVYTSSGSQKSRLLIADLPIGNSSYKCTKNFNSKIIELETDDKDESYSYKHYELTRDDSIYVLKEREARKTICQGRVCCTIDYKIESAFSDLDISNKLIVIVRDGLRKEIFYWHEQVCILATLNSPFDSENLAENKFSAEGIVGFEKLSLEGTYTSKYVYPIAAHNVTNLLPRYRRQFNCEENTDKPEWFTYRMSLANNSGLKPLYSFGMYGRAYNEDKMPEWWLNGDSLADYYTSQLELQNSFLGRFLAPTIVVSMITITILIVFVKLIETRNS